MQSTEMFQEVDTEVERSQKLYFRSHTTIFSSRYDPRFQYCLYVPPAFDNDRENYRLVVAMHGTGRSMTHYRDAFAEIARYNRCVVLAPLFPVGPLGDGNSHGFKYIVEQDIRYDTVLLNMIEEVSASLNYDFGRFLLFGYSGGGHFVHRFFYLQPKNSWPSPSARPAPSRCLMIKRCGGLAYKTSKRFLKNSLIMPRCVRLPCSLWWEKWTSKPGKSPISLAGNIISPVVTMRAPHVLTAIPRC